MSPPDRCCCLLCCTVLSLVAEVATGCFAVAAPVGVVVVVAAAAALAFVDVPAVALADCGFPSTVGRLIK
jgi:hypothetical protein